jgi:hypothetical protein
VHFAVGRYIRRSLIELSWPHGFVHIKLLGDLPVGTTSLQEARHAAGYLSKYVGKDFDKARMPGLHRYEVAQSFQPALSRLWGRTAGEVIGQAADLMGAEPVTFWTSESEPLWRAPPSVWVQWA